MDGFHTLDASLPDVSPSQAGQVVEALVSGASVMIVGETGIAGCLRVVAQMLGGSRTRVVSVCPPLALPDFLQQVACAHPASDESALERGFSALTETGVGCDRIVLLVEDAHLLPHPTLHYIEMAMRAGQQLQAVLAGQPPLVELLGLAGFKSLRQRLSVQVSAAPLPGQALDVPRLPVLASISAHPNAPPAKMSHVPRASLWELASLAGAVAAGVAAAWLARPVTAPVTAVAAHVMRQPSAAFQAAAPQNPGLADLLPATGALPEVASAPIPDPAPAASIAEAPAPTLPMPSASLPILDLPPAAVAEAAAPALPDAPSAPDAPPGIAVAPTPEPPPATTAEMPALTPSAPPVVQAAPAGPGQVVFSDAPPSTVANSTPAFLAPASQPAPAPPVPQPTFRPVRERPAPPRVARVAAPTLTQDHHRCRDIVLRAQLGDTPTDADRSFLRNGCR